MPIVYQTTNQVTGRYYIGYHNGSNDSYLGSGLALKDAIEKYGRENFIRQTIYEGTEEECLELEEFIVDEEFVLSESNYNLTVGGGMPPSQPGNQHALGMTYTHSKEAREAIAKSRTGKRWSEDIKRKMSENRKGKATGSNNAMASAENRAKVAASKIGRKKVYQPDGSFKYLRPEEIS